MRKGSPFFPAAIILLVVSSIQSISAAAETGLDQEYAQVRKIALKDPRVREAFEKANQRLDEKILQIDPALKPMVDREKAAPATAEIQGSRKEEHPAASSAPRTHSAEHIVVKGDTLSSIAARYKVKVPVLEKVNHITDDRKLRVGQKLVIPGAESQETQPEEDSGAR